MSSVLRVLREVFAFPLQCSGEPKIPRSLSFLGSGGADLDTLPKQRQKNQSPPSARLRESSEEVGALKRGSGWGVVKIYPVARNLNRRARKI